MLPTHPKFIQVLTLNRSPLLRSCSQPPSISLLERETADTELPAVCSGDVSAEIEHEAQPIGLERPGGRRVDLGGHVCSHQGGAGEAVERGGEELAGQSDHEFVDGRRGCQLQDVEQQLGGEFVEEEALRLLVDVLPEDVRVDERHALRELVLLGFHDVVFVHVTGREVGVGIFLCLVQWTCHCLGWDEVQSDQG